MPGFDGTGPRGTGPMTGGGRGFCSPYSARASWRPFGISRRVGYNYPFGSVTTRGQEIDFLKNEAQELKRTLEEINTRIKELAGEGK
jgi:hypothetical protein